MALPEFERAYLNRWTAARREPVLPPEHWNHPDVLVPDCHPDEPLVFALDVTPDRNAATVAVSDGTVVELIQNAPGTEWLVGRCTELHQKWKAPFVVDPAGPAASLIPALVAAGCTVRQPKAREYAAACAQLFDAVVAHEVQHRGQDELELALSAATRRRRGDVWTWARNDTTTDISPVVAVTLARWGASSPEANTKPRKPVFAW
jgi:hypothetical protein